MGGEKIMGSEEIFKKTGNGGWANTTGFRGDSGEIGAFVKSWAEVATEDALFTGSAGVDQNGTTSNHWAGDQIWDAGGGNDERKIV